MNTHVLAAIARRDLTVVARSRAVSMPILILPIIFFVVMPVVVTLGGATFGTSGLGGRAGDIEELVAVMPEPLRRDLGSLPPAAQIIVWSLEYLFATFFLIVPLMTSAVIAADSFAGEKERKTLEALVYTPTSDLELYLGKVLAPWVAAVVVSTLGYLAYALVANLFGAATVGRLIVVTPRWLLVVIWLAPAVAALTVGALVLVSSRVRGFQEAYQLGGIVVLPVILLFVGQLSGALYFDLPIVALVAAVVTGLAAATLWLGFRSFRRERLLVQL